MELTQDIIDLSYLRSLFWPSNRSYVLYPLLPMSTACVVVASQILLHQHLCHTLVLIKHVVWFPSLTLQFFFYKQLFKLNFILWMWVLPVRKTTRHTYCLLLVNECSVNLHLVHSDICCPMYSWLFNFWLLLFCHVHWHFFLVYLVVFSCKIVLMFFSKFQGFN